MYLFELDDYFAAHIGKWPMLQITTQYTTSTHDVIWKKCLLGIGLGHYVLNLIKL